MAYITAADLKLYMKIENASNDETAQLTKFCNRAQTIIERFTHRNFEPSTFIQYFTPLAVNNGGDLIDNYTLSLDQDLSSLISITNGDGTVIPNNQVVLLPLNTYPKYAIRIKQSTSYWWTYTGSPEGAVAINAAWSYGNTVPDDIVEAALEIAAYLYRKREGGPESDRAIISPDGFVIAASSMGKDIFGLLKPFVRVLI